jgi:hypothetical protein
LGHKRRHKKKLSMLLNFSSSSLMFQTNKLVCWSLPSLFQASLIFEKQRGEYLPEYVLHL